MRPDRAEALHNAPLHDLLVILLRQFTRLLDQHNIDLTEKDIQSIVSDIIEDNPPGDKALAVRLAVSELVEESVAGLARWALTFAQSLGTDMGDMPGWETTAEFLDLANEKGNAELRIASGSTLVAALGDLCYTHYLLDAIAHDPDELESVVAHRVLSRASGVNMDAEDWAAQVRAWCDEKIN